MPGTKMISFISHNLVLLAALMAAPFPFTGFAIVATDPMFEVIRYNYQTRELTGEGINTVRLPNGMVTQEPMYRAFFESQLNPEVAPKGASLNEEARSYADTLYNCLVENASQGWFSGGSDPNAFQSYKIQLASFLRYYVTTLSLLPDYQKYPIENGVRQHNCNSSSSFSVLRYSDIGYLAYKRKFEKDGYASAVKDRLRPYACGSAQPNFDVLSFLYFVTEPLGYTLGSYLFTTYGLDPMTETPEAIFSCKTTPWLYSTQGQEVGEKPTWNELGMNLYHGFGLTPVHTWIAQQHYYETWVGTVFDFTPVLGGAWAAADSFEDFREGRNVYGLPASRYVSGGMFALNFLFTMTDVVSFKLNGATLSKLKDYRALSKSLTNPDEISAMVRKVKGVLRASITPNGQAVGEVVSKVRHLFGTPLSLDEVWRTWASGWRDFDIEKTKLFAAGMEKKLRAARQEIKDHLRFGGHTPDLYDYVKQTIEDGVAYATAKATYPGASELTLIGYIKDMSHGKIKSDLSRLGNGSWVIGNNIPEAIRKEFLQFAQGPGHEVMNDWYIRNVEIIIDKKPFIVKQISMSADNGISGSVNYIATNAAKEAMDNELKSLFALAVDINTPVEKAMEHVIHMEWLINQVLPYKGGNSSIGQAWKHVVMEARGMRLGRMADGIGFDLKAWIKTSQEYILEHPSYYHRADEVLDGVVYAVPPPNVSGSTSPIGMASKKPEGLLEIKSKISLVSTVQGTRKFSGWFAGEANFIEWENGPQSQFLVPSHYPDVWKNPVPIRIVAYETDSKGSPINLDTPIAVGDLQDPPSDPELAVFSQWKKPGFDIEIPSSNPDGTFKIFAEWIGTEKRKNLQLGCDYALGILEPVNGIVLMTGNQVRDIARSRDQSSKFYTYIFIDVTGSKPGDRLDFKLESSVGVTSSSALLSILSGSRAGHEMHTQKNGVCYRNQYRDDKTACDSQYSNGGFTVPLNGAQEILVNFLTTKVKIVSCNLIKAGN